MTPNEPRPNWKLYLAGAGIYALIALGSYGMGRLISGYVLMLHSRPAATSSTSFTI